MAAASLRERYRAALAELAGAEADPAKLEAAFHLVRAADDAGVLDADARGVSLALFLRMAAVEEADRRWPFAQIGRELAARGEPRYLQYQIPRVRTDADRRELLAQHELWGRAAVAAAAADPIPVASRPAGGPLRVALVSSDLRQHVTLAFAEPLIVHAAEHGVELYCYSAQPGAPDRGQQHVAAHVAAFRHLPGADARMIAQAVAGDAPDVAIEIGGSIGFNRGDALAWRLAPRQISWLGYPHSAGLPTIDHILLDPWLAPADPGLLSETALLMPRSWIALTRGYLPETPPLDPQLPEERKGCVTFGTAGSPYKFSAAMMQAWARVLRAVPGSRLMIIRPEGALETFRQNIAVHFEGVADRIDFVPVWGDHRRWLAEVDISLDTFPLTGGTTTCEALWMGSLLVSLEGPAIYERLSRSILHSAGLDDLCAATQDAYVAKAVELAGDRERRRRWRTEGRRIMAAGPLGDPEGFAAEFFALLKSL